MAKRGDKRTGGRGIRATLAGAVLVLTALALPASPLLAGPAECLDHAARAEDGAAPRIEVLVADLEKDQGNRLTGRLVDVLGRTGAIRVFRPCQKIPLGKAPMASILGDEPWVSARRMLRRLDVEIFILGRVVNRDGWVRLWLVGNHPGSIDEAVISDIWAKQLSGDFDRGFANQTMYTLDAYVDNYIDLQSADNAAAFVKALALLDLASMKRPLFGAETDTVFLNRLRWQSLKRLGVDDTDSALGWWIDAYQEALRLASRTNAPLQWARIQNGLGAAFSRMGLRPTKQLMARQLGPNHDSESALSPDRLLKAVSHYRRALEIHTRRHDPFEWAEAHANIGFAFLDIARSEKDTANLGLSIAAFRSALQEYTLERAPVLRYEIQESLGRALRWFGEREPGTAALEQAVAFFPDMLAERNQYVYRWRKLRPIIDYATALDSLGQRESGTDRFYEEIEVLLQATTIYSRASNPSEWARLQLALGSAFRSLGKRKGGTEDLEKSLAAYRRALEVFEANADRATDDDIYAIMARSLIRHVQKLLSERQ